MEHVGDEQGRNVRPRGSAQSGWLLLILTSALALRTYHIAYPVWDYHNWRQSITLMVARHFARHDFPLLHPEVAWIGNRPSDPSYFSAEFSIQSALAALLYKAFGEQDALARLVVIAFSLLGIYCLYDLLNRRVSPSAARIGAFVLSLLPYYLFFGRVFMPDIPAIALALAGLDVLDAWTDHPHSTGRLLAAALLTASAVLQKLTVILVAFPVIYLFWLVYGRNLWKRGAPYLFGFIVTCPALAWYYGHAIVMARQSVLSSLVMQQSLFGHHLELWLQRPFLQQVIAALPNEAFSPLGFSLALLGCFWTVRGRAVGTFRCWLFGAALVLFLMPGVIANNKYYLSLLLPGGAALAGIALDRLGQYRGGRPAVMAILSLFTASAIFSALPLYRPDRLPYNLGLVLNGLTEPDDLLATEAGGSPSVLYAADRRGWLLEREFDPERVDSLKRIGARYYADTFAADATEQREFFRALDARYERLTTADASWQIYDLAAPATAVRFMPDLPHSRIVEYGGVIEFRGVSVIQLLPAPAVFEVKYEWHCLRTPATGLRVFVHVTDSAGRTVYQQDHWPRGGRFPSSNWHAGDYVLERYVLALPASLPTGEYQLRLGWFAPDSGTRLAILNPAHGDEEDRATVATITVSPPPRYGWFGID